MNFNTLISTGKSIYDAFTSDELSTIDSDLTKRGELKLLKEVEKTKQTVVKAQANVLLGEVNGESKLQRLWRPILMISFGGIVVLAYGVFPVLNALMHILHITFSTTVNDVVLEAVVQIPELVIPEQMWNLLQIGIGGYIVGRSVEKSIEKYQGKK